MRAGIIALACLLTACESMSPYEKAWQAMHLVDVAQTINGAASDPCYREVGWDTQKIIGEHPHRDAVLAWGVGSSLVHYFVGRWLDQSDWPDGIKMVLRSIDLGHKGMVVASNYSEGVRIFGPNDSECSASRKAEG